MKRPVTSQKVIDVFSELVDSQDKKGLSKYGVTIDTASDYDWNLMALEEAVDGLKYMMKENQFLRVRLKEYAKKSWFPIYEENLKLAEENERMMKDVSFWKLAYESENEIRVKYGDENERLKRVIKSYDNALTNMVNHLSGELKGGK